MKLHRVPNRSYRRQRMPINTDRIKALRTRVIIDGKPMSMEEAARRAGLSGGRGDWWRIETGRKSNIELDTLERIAAVLNTTAKDLLK